MAPIASAISPRLCRLPLEEFFDWSLLEAALGEGPDTNCFPRRAVLVKRREPSRPSSYLQRSKWLPRPRLPPAQKRDTEQCREPTEAGRLYRGIALFFAWKI